MYQRRLKIFVVLCVSVLMIAVGRLTFLQLFRVEHARDAARQMRILPPEQLATVRGKILDRYGRTLALDRPAFSLHISYELTRHADARWRQGHIARQVNPATPRRQVETRMADQWADSQNMLQHAIELAAELSDLPQEQIERRIDDINNRIWELTRYIWWRRRNPDAAMAEYRQQRDAIDPGQLVRMDLREMRDFFPLIELTSDEALLTAQLELLQMQGLAIRPEARRSYPYGTAACQFLGWVAPGQEHEMQLFEDDEYQRYLEGEVLGKEGIEQAFEPLLRGRRGRVIYDKDGNELSRTNPQYGADVSLTLDIELQQEIETLLSNPETNPNFERACTAVVLDGATNDILAAASTPVFDLNTVRRDYNRLFNDPNQPMLHKALERNYPPGSTAKPLMLLIGLEENNIHPDEVISCPISGPPSGWPRCLLQRSYGSCHDWRWEGQGGNNARNAMRGSCNIYFSQLAHRLDAADLQAWLWKLGFGRAILHVDLPQVFVRDNPHFAEFSVPGIRQAHGNLIYGIQARPAESADELATLPAWEKKWWGIGQGNLRVTVLQAANALAAIARNGLYKAPRLVLDEADPFNERYQRQLPISRQTTHIVREAMSAVVNEDGGSAYRIFKDSPLFDRGLAIYGKTGSTQNPEHAWFECFAEDKAGRFIVVVVLVEGGSRGAADAAPLGHAILQRCADAGYIGTRPAPTER